MIPHRLPHLESLKFPKDTQLPIYVSLLCISKQNAKYSHGPDRPPCGTNALIGEKFIKSPVKARVVKILSAMSACNVTIIGRVVESSSLSAFNNLETRLNVSILIV